MTDRENFLERWSRRKIEAEQPAQDDAHQDVARKDVARQDLAAGAPEHERENETRGNEASSTEAAPTQPARGDKTAAPPEAKPAFDIASLPSLESITAATDVRAFLAPGVPAELTRAALRRAWIADPAIRDFKGLAENDWDFTDPGAMSGFGNLPANYDVRKVVAQIFGETDKTDDATAAAGTEPPLTPAVQRSDQPREIASVEPAQPVAVTEQDGGDDGEADTPAQVEADIVQRNNNIATHDSISAAPEDEPKTRRSHGRALPQ